MNNAATQDAIETLEDYTEFCRWKQTHRPLVKSRVPMSFSAEKRKGTEADVVRKVLDLLERGLEDGKINLETFERFKELGEGALQRLEGGQSGSSEFAKSIVTGARLGMLSPVAATAMSTVGQNLDGRVSSDYFADWVSIGR